MMAELEKEHVRIKIDAEFLVINKYRVLIISTSFIECIKINIQNLLTKLMSLNVQKIICIVNTIFITEQPS